MTGEGIAGARRAPARFNRGVPSRPLSESLTRIPNPGRRNSDGPPNPSRGGPTRASGGRLCAHAGRRAPHGARRKARVARPSRTLTAPRRRRRAARMQPFSLYSRYAVSAATPMVEHPGRCHGDTTAVTAPRLSRRHHGCHGATAVMAPRLSRRNCCNGAARRCRRWRSTP